MTTQSSPPARNTRPLESPSSMETAPDQPAASNQPDAQSQNRLAFLVFIGTLLGSLLGLLASLSDASGLIVPVVDLFSPRPIVRTVGSSTILGEGVGVAADWQVSFTEQTKWEMDVPIAGTIERTVRMQTEGVGSVNAFQEATTGSVHLLPASEPMPPEYQQQMQAKGIEIRCAGVIGYDIIAFVTDIKNNLPRPISTRDLSSILTGDMTNWSQVGGSDKPINILARRGSGTTDIVLNALTGSTEFRPHFNACESNVDCLDMALSTPGSLYWVSTAWLETQPPDYLRPILIQRGTLPATDPLAETFNPDNYPTELLRPLYMYVLRGGPISAESSNWAQRFFTYVRGVQGQKTLEEHHFSTHFNAPADVSAILPEGFGQRLNGPPVVCHP